MDKQLDATFAITDKDVEAVKVDAISDIETQQQLYIDFCAIGGIITDDDGSFHKMTSSELSQKIGVDRVTLWRWRKQIKNFDKRVSSRRMEISKGSRASKVYNGLYLRAAKGHAAEVRLWAEIFDGFQPAPQRLQHSIGNGFADVMKVAQSRREAVEGEVVDE